MVALKQGYDLAEEVRRLKEERNAVILAHNYQVPEIQDLADYVGDSLGLSYRAKETGVLPDLEAGCSLSESCPADKLEAFLAQNAVKNYYVIAYINCSAGVKAFSDVICTSGN